MASTAGSQIEVMSPNSTDLEQLAAENEALRHQLRRAQSLATIGTITAMIVHEFNNILTPIMNYARLAGDGDEEMTAKALSKAISGGQQGVDICEALLGLLRDDSSEPTDEPVGDLVRHSLLATGRSLTKDGIDLQLDIPDDLTVRVRPAEFKQVLVNLLLNARAALLEKGRGGQVAVDARREGDHVMMRVTDTGTGIDPANLEQVFEPFFTTKDGRNGTQVGTGLGLALCREILTSMGGEIRVESELGRFTTFHIQLPT